MWGWRRWYDMEAAVALPVKFQDLANRIWGEVMQACDAYFVSHEPAWAGDSRAPEFSDEQVARQFQQWDGYRRDAGAMTWRQNTTKDYAYDFTALPPGWKRAVCERIWAH